MESLPFSSVRMESASYGQQYAGSLYKPFPNSQVNVNMAHRQTSGILKLAVVLFGILLLPLRASALGYTQEPGVTATQWFQPLPTGTMDNRTANEIKYSVGNESGPFNLPQWAQRGMLIRKGGNDLYCLGNLSWALMNLGELNMGEYSGAAGTLALLPTAGALIGAPAKELWLIFKLMPIAGVLTMFLSLGGTIMPSSSGEYDLDSFDYGGMMATDRQKERAKGRAQLEAEMGHLEDWERLARRVARRAVDLTGGNGYTSIWIASFFQLVFFGAILVVLWYGQRGAVIPWWCRVC